MARRYGRARGGARCEGSAPVNAPASTTVVSSVRLGGEAVFSTWAGGTTSGRFGDWVREALSPSPRAGDVVVMDNLAAHHARGVGEALRAAGCEVRYLPPYSPDLNPIEKMRSKVKAALRAASARTPEALAQAIPEAIATVTASDCEGWFRSCGYDC